MSSHALVMPRSSDRGEARRTARAVAVVKGGGALGGEPRVSLLPTEVNDVAKARAARRRLGVGVVFVLLVVLAGVGGAYYLSMTAEAELASARSNQTSLLAQEAQFSDLKAAKVGIATIEAGQYVGASTEIDWTAYLESLQATLPDGVLITNVAIDSASPFMDYAQSSSPLEGSRVATLLFTATSPGLPSIPSWLDGLATLKGFADAVPGSVNVEGDGTYVVNITMHINSDAFALRFPGEDKK
ncbi:MAG: pilM [Rhodoglobus sp.]|nr:pilM [Rhodoglobus sp.]